VEVPLRSELVFYIPQDEARAMLNELDFLFGKAFGDVSKSREQILAQLPSLLALLVQVAGYFPNTIDLEAYLPVVRK
jgi:hypothetical protein